MAADEESIEQAAAERRERLKALRAAQELFDTPDDDSSHPKNTSQDGDSANNGDRLYFSLLLLFFLLLALYAFAFN